MKSKFHFQKVVLVLIFLTSTLSLSVFASGNSTSTEERTIKRGAYTLKFTCKSDGFSEETNQKLIETFFKVYPVLVKKYNKKSPHIVTFIIDPEYDGVAATSNDQVVFSVKYMTSHPGDLDVVTHEVMHIVQAYGEDSSMPWWVTEGIADYVRSVYGVDNAGAGWKLPEFSEKQNYDNSYRVTARFFAWLEHSGYKGIVKKMDEAGRKKSYSDGAIWKRFTGKSVEELWADYSRNPAL